MNIRMPNGEFVTNNSGAIAFALWAEHIEQERKKGKFLDIPTAIVACVGSPTFYADRATVQAGKFYWDNLLKKIDKVKSETSFSNNYTDSDINHIVKAEACVDYGEPHGDTYSRQLIAEAINKNSRSSLKLKADDVCFTVGATGALNTIFDVIKKNSPDGVIITPSPYYWIYQGKKHDNNLYTFSMLDCPGYQITAEAVSQCVLKAKHENKKIAAFIFCDPNNPIGTTIDPERWLEIAAVLKNEPDAVIILDLSYADLKLSGPAYLSLLDLVPSLSDRIVAIYSGTKGLSMAGERLSYTVIPNQKLAHQFKFEVLTSYIHAPRSSQYAYARSVVDVNLQERKMMCDFYNAQVKLVNNMLQELGLAMPDQAYKCSGAFYILGDFSIFQGVRLPKNVRELFGIKNTIAKTDFDIAAYLIVTTGIYVAPLSFGFNADPDKCYMRISCCVGIQNLQEMKSRLKNQLNLIKQTTFETARMFQPLVKAPDASVWPQIQCKL